MPQNQSDSLDLATIQQIKSLETQAVQAALASEWTKAIELNRQILKLDERNTESYNRLGRSYSEQGDLEKARSSYRSVLHIDPYNSIALKNLERLKLANGTTKASSGSVLNPDLFMEEPGKTKVLEATELAEPMILASLHSADQVTIEASSQEISFKSSSGRKLGTYKGELADKLSTLLKAGNIYEAYVKSIKPTELKIFVREIKRAAKFQNIPSFPTTDNGFRPYVHEGTVDVPPPNVEMEHTDTSATEAAVAKKLNSVESLAEQELDRHNSDDSEEE